MARVILASGSQHRAMLLKNAGVDFDQIPSKLDERTIEAPLDKTDVTPKERAQILAAAKGNDISQKNPDVLVIGCDQILFLENTVLHKPENMEEARQRLLALSGKTHFLYSAITLSYDGETVWSHVAPCPMTMRPLSPAFIGRYLAEVGQQVLSSVGAYQIEGVGAQLFSNIEGDIFSIIGLPLLPLLEELRNRGEMDG